MLQSIEEYWWVYIIIMTILVMIQIARDEKKNDIWGKKLHKKLCTFPISIEYKGRKLVIDREREYFKCSYFDCGWDERIPEKYTYFINGNPIVCVTVIKYTIRSHYFTTLNDNYDTSDFEGIVKEAIKEQKKQDDIRFNELLKKDQIKLYELVSQEESTNE